MGEALQALGDRLAAFGLAASLPPDPPGGAPLHAAGAVATRAGRFLRALASVRELGLRREFDTSARAWVTRGALRLR